MVKGLDKFREYFADFSEQYVLIGGARLIYHLMRLAQTFAQQKILMLYSLSRR